jgi:prepilin-type N-terminal cleavage/methylation domain-containing protein
MTVMLNARRQSGFTLVEVTMTLAISGLLILIAIVGQAQLRRRAQFSDAVERVKNNLNRGRSEAITTVNCRTGASCNVNDGTDSADELIGRELIFDPAQPFLQVYSLRRPVSGANYATLDGYQMPYAWGLKFSSAKIGLAAQSTNPAAVVFWRQSSDGRLVASALTCANATCSEALDPNNYPGVSGSVVLNFVDPDGLTAREMVDLPGGSITRSIP